MSFANQTLKVRPSRGVVFDIDPWEVGPDFYTNARNVSFTDGFPDRFSGQSQVYGTLLHKPSYLQSVGNQAGNFWVYAGDSAVSVVEGSTHSDISWAGQSTVGFNNAWTGDLLNNIVILNNGLDTPHYWDGNVVNPMLELPGWPAGTVCKAIRAFRFYLFAFDITEPGGAFVNKLLFSDSAAPGTVPGDWAPAIDNDAGFVELAATQGPIIDGGALRESMMLYKADSTWVAEFVGGNQIFAFRKLFHSSGILNRNCLMEWETNHVVLTDTDVVLTDGNSLRSIADKKVRRLINQSIDGDNIGNAFLGHNRALREIWVCFPDVGMTTCTTTAIWNYRDDTWTIRDLPGITHANSGIISAGVPSSDWDSQLGSWDAQTVIWNDQGFSLRGDNMILAGYDDSLLYEVDGATDFNGLPVTAVISKEKMNFDEPDRYKQVKRIWPKVKAANGTLINVRIGASPDADDNETFTPSVPFVVGTDRHVDIFANGRYLTFEFSSTGSAAWRMTGFDVEYRLGSFF